MPDVKFHAITKTQYTALTPKDENALYFLTDAQQIFKGSIRYSHPVQVVSALPTGSAAVVGTLYVDTVGKITKTYDGTNWHTVGPLIATAIADGAAGSTEEAASTKAVVDYVGNEISKVNASAQSAVTSVSIASKKLSVATNSGIPVETAITGFFDGATYTGATGILKFTTNGGTEVEINLPKEDFLATASRHEVVAGDLTGDDAAVYSGCTAGDVGILMTMTQGTKLFVKLTDLIDTYTGKVPVANDTVAVTVNGYEVAASVRVSETAGNKITINADGLYVAQDTIGSGKTGVVLVADASGVASDSGKTLGGTTLPENPTANVLATELATKTYVDAALTWKTV